MSETKSQEASRKELDEMNERYRQVAFLSDEERHNLEQEIVKFAVTWGRGNQDDLEYLFALASGATSPHVLGLAAENPLFYEALGRLGDSVVVPLLKKALKSCDKKRRICFHVKDMFRALILMDDERAFQAVESLLKNPRKSKLTHDFVNALEELPRQRYLPMIISLAKSGLTFKLDFILARMAEQSRIAFAKLLRDKNDKVRYVAANALLRLPDEHLDESTLEILNRIVENRKEDILTRSKAAEILKRIGMEIPSLFRDRPQRNVSSNLQRFVRGILYPNERPDDWALEEIVELRYPDDSARITIRHLIGMPHADIKVWRGCFWDVFHMGFQFSKNLLPRGTYKVVGLTRATRFESKALRPDYIIERLDLILIGIVNEIVSERGEEYTRIINTINTAIAEGRSLMVKGRPTWEVDWDKIREQGGC